MLFIGESEYFMCLFTRLHNQSQVDAAKEYLSGKKQQRRVTKVVMLNLPPTPYMLELVKWLSEQGKKVIIRDHHAPKPGSVDERDLRTKLIISEISALPGVEAAFHRRDQKASCVTLSDLGEFAESDTVVMAGSNFDGMLSAFRAVGFEYPGMERDADILDGPPAGMTLMGGLTQAGDWFRKTWHLVPIASNPSQQTLSKLPPEEQEEIARKQKLAFQEEQEEVMRMQRRVIERFLDLVAGDEQRSREAEIFFRNREREWEAVSKESWRLDVRRYGDGSIVVADTTGRDRSQYDPVMLSLRLQEDEQAIVSCIIRDSGHVAKHYDSEMVLHVTPSWQEDVDLRKVFDATGLRYETPEDGMLCNMSVLAYCVPNIFFGQVLDILERRIASVKKKRKDSPWRQPTNPPHRSHSRA